MGRNKGKYDSYLIGLFYNPRTSYSIYLDVFRNNVERALDTVNNIIILGDMNEDLFKVSKGAKIRNPTMHYLKDVLLFDPLHNTISQLS